MLLTYCLQIAASLVARTSARLEVQANGASHFSFQNVTRKWQEHVNIVAENTICNINPYLWFLMVFTVRLGLGLVSVSA